VHNVEKVISGAQIGADIAGLRAAKRVELETGGWMPRGFIARDGPHPEYADQYGIKEHASSKYPPRTEQNVFDADATVRFATNFQSAGEICTLNAIKRYEKPYLDVPIRGWILMHPDQFMLWLALEEVRVLNVAGNALPWIEPLVEEFLVVALHASA
jgi:hypothetical protein